MYFQNKPVFLKWTLPAVDAGHWNILLCTACQFLPDANEVMQLLLKTQTEMEELEADDPQVCCFYHCSSC